ncbi:MAG: ParA family protein [Alphaproteobacteria bacterium]|nr:ParA family protein [Alphaproteobacteria bacterium]
MSIEVLQAAAAILGVAFTLAIACSTAAYFVGNVIARNVEETKRIGLKNENTGLSVQLAQAERQIGDLNDALKKSTGDGKLAAEDSMFAGRVETVAQFLSVFGNSVWLAKETAERSEPKQSNLKIITFANNKGGVGKTTLSANYARYLHKAGRRVLMVDLDYQGSMTATALAATSTESREGASADIPANAYSWLDEPSDPDDFIRSLTRLGDGDRFFLVESSYNLPSEEDRNLFLWLVGRSKTDVRFRLHELLYSKAVLGRFDVVIIDSPPKLSVGSVNALTASTHYVVPTILDTLSTTPIRFLLSSYKGLFKNLGVSPELVGVAAVKTRYNVLRPDEVVLVEELDQLVKQSAPSAQVFASTLPFSVDYAEAAGRSFVVDDTKAGKKMRVLFAEISRSIGL